MATAENLSRWRPRKGEGWPPGREIIAGAAARWAAVLRAAYRMSELGLDVQTARVLEVGAGYGDGLRPLLLAGFLPQHLTGIDLMAERLATARERLPGMTFVHGDGADMRPHFNDAAFDLVSEQFCFCHIPRDDVKRRIASELIRVLKPGGFVLILDWRLRAPSRGIYGVSQAYIRELFQVGSLTDRVAVYPSHLWPPIGNRVSRSLPALYQVGWLLPLLVGSKVTLLRKR
jgi:SAM-dependent methyltransferase